MTAILNDRLLDFGLIILYNECNVIHVCSAKPTSFAQVASVTLGNNALGIHNVFPNVTGGIAQASNFANGSITGNGLVVAWAAVDTVNSRLLAAGDITPQYQRQVTAGAKWSLANLQIQIPGSLSPPAPAGASIMPGTGIMGV